MVGNVTARFHYDLSHRLLAESRFSHSVIGDFTRVSENIWLNGMLVGEVVSTYSSGSLNGRALRAVHTDHLGTPRKVTNPDQSVVWDAVYRPFGELDNNPTAVADTNLRFPGQYADAETGLNYNYFRDYDPSLGRYIQSDPIGLQGGWNSYAYVRGNPVMRVDPNGLEGGGGRSGSAPPPDTGQRECKADGCTLGCLAVALGETVNHIRVYSVNDPLLGRRAITGPGWIRLTVPCATLWNDDWLMLHEYYHVIRQWPKYGGAGGTIDYLRNWRQWESDANKFANKKRQRDLRKCIENCRSCPT